ncbi:transmembrane protein 265 [Oryzias latipes]|uniref:transmembrane protein 265 n=1 Tax=Oryzias latipes TaxID=8090 RepID=UPI0002A49523|nr:transmembrane protein 265 [Oryzias latipes]
MPESAEAPRDEVMPLTVVAQRGDQDRRDETCKPVASRVRRMISYVRNDDSYRVLAIFSIICGISCIGMKALISSVKAKERKNDREASARLSKEAKKFGIISIVTLYAFLISIFCLLALVSYLLTLKD